MATKIREEATLITMVDGSKHMRNEALTLTATSSIGCYTSLGGGSQFLITFGSSTLDHLVLRGFQDLFKTQYAQHTTMITRSAWISLIIANVLIPVAILTFATGFFPYKPFLSGIAKYGESATYGTPPEAPFDKIIFMVVDALRRLEPIRSSFVIVF
ncbi:MAG: major facilitator super transporter protein [Pycnora praestabilis]|nr:MAG: major facilitator super transporter protein [Pycnora praestabilis]